MENDDEQNLLATNEQWALFGPPSTDSTSTGQSCNEDTTLFFLWISEDELPTQFLAACEILNTDPPDWAGIKLSFQAEPSPGFCLEISKGWEPVNEEQEEDLFRKMIWELDRARVMT